MKELVFNTGGRKLFNEDLDVVQKLGKSIEAFYADELPFVISGITPTLVSGTTYNISAGYAWLGGRVRFFSGSSNINLGVSTYLNANDVNESTEYNDTVTRVSTTDYKTVLSTSLISSVSSLQILPTGTRNYVNNVLGGKFAMLTPATAGQTIEGNITLRAVTATSLKFGAGQTVSSVNTSLSIPNNNTSVSTNNVLTAHVVPKGFIGMWSGSPSEVPANWVLCDGRAAVNGQAIPDLRGRFIVGYSNIDTDYNAVGKSDGKKTVAITPDQMPSHSHGKGTLVAAYGGEHLHSIRGEKMQKSGDSTKEVWALDTGGDPSWGTKSFITDSTGSQGAHGHSITGNTSPVGNGAAHENRPPYYTLAYIIKTI